MTKKVYKSAMGKPVDMGALLLQNESVRAVGNMGVNARGDVIDSQNRIIDKKSNQIRKQHRKQTNVMTGPATSSTLAAKQVKRPAVPVIEDTFEDLPDDNDVVAEDIVSETAEVSAPNLQGGLAAAIAKSRTVAQTLEKTPKQLAKESPIKKI